MIDLKQRSRTKFEWKEFMVLSMITLSCAIKTWAQWGDLRIDTGRELYIPQAILAGKELYRDLMYPYGPLAPYLNAAIFYLFGAHLRVLYVWGIALVVVSAVLIYFIAREYLSRLGGLVISVAYLLLAFQPGLFNLVLPYSYAASYGSLFSLLFFYFLLRHLNTERNTFLSWAGILAGLATATKIEFGAACFVTLGLYLLFQVRRLAISRFIGQCCEAFIPGLVIAAAGYGWFIRKTTLANWLHDNWPGAQISFYWLERQGFRFSIREIGVLILISFVCLLFWYLIAKAGARLLFVPERRRNVLGSFVVVVAFAVIGWKNFGLVAVHLLRLFVFPVSMYFAGIALIVVSIYRWKGDGYSKLTIKTLALAVFSVLLNWRVAFHVLPGRYSIYYASLLFLCFVLVLYEFYIADVSKFVFESERCGFKVYAINRIGVAAFLFISSAIVRFKTYYRARIYWRAAVRSNTISGDHRFYEGGKRAREGDGHHTRGNLSLLFCRYVMPDTLVCDTACNFP